MDVTSNEAIAAADAAATAAEEALDAEIMQVSVRAWDAGTYKPVGSLGSIVGLIYPGDLPMSLLTRYWVQLGRRVSNMYLECYPQICIGVMVGSPFSFPHYS